MEEENKYLTILRKHWSKLLLGILTIACLAAWTERFLRRSENQSKQDFMLANQIFEEFQKGDYLPTESLEAAENILKRHPELHPKYDLMLSLIFFSQADPAKGKQYAESMIRSADATLPCHYKDYAYTTLLISEGDYAKAFEKALSLQKELCGNDNYQILEAMNTVRLLFLADYLGDKNQKELFWNQLQKHPAYPDIQPLFQEGNLSLLDYVKR